jgi:hypothetical protein
LLSIFSIAIIVFDAISPPFRFSPLLRRYADTLMPRLSPIRHYYCQIFRQLMPAAPMPCCFAALFRAS